MDLSCNFYPHQQINSCSDSSHSASSMASEEEEVTSSASSSSGPLQDMSSLLQQLPLKRGLSKHYPWKSQSFTSLANVASLEDLAKPENPYAKKLKTCRSCDGGSADQGRRLKITSKKSSRTRRSCFLGNRPPMAPPHRSAKTSSSISNQASMFA